MLPLRTQLPMDLPKELSRDLPAISRPRLSQSPKFRQRKQVRRRPAWPVADSNGFSPVNSLQTAPPWPRLTPGTIRNSWPIPPLEILPLGLAGIVPATRQITHGQRQAIVVNRIPQRLNRPIRVVRPALWIRRIGLLKAMASKPQIAEIGAHLTI